MIKIPSLATVPIAASWPCLVPSIPWRADDGITSLVSWCYLSDASTASSHYQRRIATNVPPPPPEPLLLSLLLIPPSRKTGIWIISPLREVEGANHSCSSYPVLGAVLFFIKPAYCSHSLYSVFTSVRHSPLLDTAGQFNLPVLILACVVTTEWRWTSFSTLPETCKFRNETWMIIKQQ